jgi:hypothetical protein
MVWLWMLFPAVLLFAALALGRARGSLDDQRHALEAEVDALGRVGGPSPTAPGVTERPPATRRRQVRR